MEALGATPVFLSSKEDYTSLASGLIDASDKSSPQSAFKGGFYEVAKYWVIELQQVPTFAFAANADFWNSLSAADQGLLTRTWYYAAMDVFTRTEYESAIMLAEAIENYGVTPNYWDGNDLAAWSEAFVSTVERHEDNPYWVEAWDLLMKYAKEVGYL